MVFSGVFRILQGGAWGARARAYNGGLGRSPQRGPGAEPLVRESGGRSPPEGLPEAETLLAFRRSMEVANLPTFVKICIVSHCDYGFLNAHSLTYCRCTR